MKFSLRNLLIVLSAVAVFLSGFATGRSFTNDAEQVPPREFVYADPLFAVTPEFIPYTAEDFVEQLQSLNDRARFCDKTDIGAYRLKK
ncbi:MAG: hypothetical protein R3E01_05960 [Pirellulaceae bacterium]